LGSMYINLLLTIELLTSLVRMCVHYIKLIEFTGFGA
jgi:hypothetical protein